MNAQSALKNRTALFTASLGLVTVAMIGCQSTPPSTEKGAGGEAKVEKSVIMEGALDAGSAKALLERGASIIDVRTVQEFSRGHVEEAKNIPIGEFSKRMSEVGDPNTPVILYCASGARSHAAAKSLKRAGYKEIYNIRTQGGWPLK